MFAVGSLGKSAGGTHQDVALGAGPSDFYLKAE